MSLPYSKKLLPFAKKLRKESTPQENHLWYDFLRKYPIRFQRQKIIDSFIADFYCHKAKLVIELDGSQHYSDSGMEYDKNRTSILNKHGIEVISFSYLIIDSNFKGVCKEIDNVVQRRLSELE